MTKDQNLMSDDPTGAGRHSPFGHWSFGIGHSARSAPAAFTLVELILVMALLATILALSAPSLSRSLRQRNLEQEAARLLALTEYGRDEAVSQGVPMVVWVDPESRRFGVNAKAGYVGEAGRDKAYALNPDLHFEPMTGVVTKDRLISAAEFAPDGTLDSSSVETMRIGDRSNSVVTVARMADGWGYEILKEASR